MTERTEWRLVLAGWILFSLSALFYLAGAIRAGDLLSIFGGLFFFVACLFFLAPHWARRPVTKSGR